MLESRHAATPDLVLIYSHHGRLLFGGHLPTPTVRESHGGLLLVLLHVVAHALNSDPNPPPPAKHLQQPVLHPHFQTQKRCVNFTASSSSRKNWPNSNIFCPQISSSHALSRVSFIANGTHFMTMMHVWKAGRMGLEEVRGWCLSQNRAK